MAKRKPDSVNTVRIELQDHERKALDKYLTAESIKNVAEGIDKLTSFENLYIIVTVIELVTGKEILPGTPNDVYYIIDALRNFDLSDFAGRGLFEFQQISKILADFAFGGFEGDESFL